MLRIMPARSKHEILLLRNKGGQILSMESCCLEMEATDSKHCILLLRIFPVRSKQQILLLRIVPAFSKQQILLLRILPARSKHGFLLLRSRSKHEIVTLSVDTFIPSTRLFRNPKYLGAAGDRLEIDICVPAQLFVCHVHMGIYVHLFFT